jgi:PadR family transcriptional regulator PadR
MSPKSPSLLQGTLDLIVLQLLRAEPTNGYELAQRIQEISRDVLTINAGSLYPAL